MDQGHENEGYIVYSVMLYTRVWCIYQTLYIAIEVYWVPVYIAIVLYCVILYILYKVIGEIRSYIIKSRIFGGNSMFRNGSPC